MPVKDEFVRELIELFKKDVSFHLLIKNCICLEALEHWGKWYVKVAPAMHHEMMNKRKPHVPRNMKYFYIKRLYPEFWNNYLSIKVKDKGAYIDEALLLYDEMCKT